MDFIADHWGLLLVVLFLGFPLLQFIRGGTASGVGPQGPRRQGRMRAPGAPPPPYQQSPEFRPPLPMHDEKPED